MSRYERPNSVLVQAVGDEVLALNTATEKYFSLNDVGVAMFERLAGGDEPDEVQRAIASEFDADPKVVAEDLSELIEALVAQGLLAPVL